MKTSLKTRIADLLNQNNTSEIDSICAELHEEQSNLIAHLDELTEFGLREYVFKRHSQIDALGKSLYRFKQLSENGLSKEAYQEAQNISRLLSEFAGTVVYKWVAEPNACDRCRSMNGMTYYSLDDIPEKPHPNCKCRLEANTQSASQTFYVNASVYEDKTQETKEEINKMKIEIEKLDQKAQENLKEVEKQEKLIKEIENKIDVNTLPPEEKRQFDEAKSGIKTINRENNILTQEIKKIKSNFKILEDFFNKDMISIVNLNIIIYNIWKKIITSKEFLDKIISKFKKQMPLSVILWEISSSKFNNINSEIKNNITKINNIEDLQNLALKQKITTKVKQQYMANDTKGIIFDEDSIYAQAISNSKEIKNFIKSNKHNFLPNAKLPDDSIAFGILNPDLFNAFHRVDIVDIYIDVELNFNAKIIDTYDFNKKDFNPFVILARIQQLHGNIENYYIVINIKIPMYKWILF